MPVIKIGETPTATRETQCKKPTGFFGRLTLRRMNKSHSKLTDWGLTHTSVESRFTVLDVGCGGGRTISKLAAMAAQGKVHGIDYSEASVAAPGATTRRQSGWAASRFIWRTLGSFPSLTTRSIW